MDFLQTTSESTMTNGVINSKILSEVIILCQYSNLGRNPRVRSIYFIFKCGQKASEYILSSW